MSNYSGSSGEYGPNGSLASQTQPMAQQQQQQQMPPPGYGYGMSRFGMMRARRVYPTETKPFYLTSEFAVSVIAAIAIAITAASSDAMGPWRAWILISVIVAAYCLSRGIAKAGTKSHAADPHDNVDLNWSGRGQHDWPQHPGPQYQEPPSTVPGPQ